MLGQYSLGEVPLILQQPDGTFPESDSVHVHETSHFDLITNTLYGYFLTRLTILEHDNQLSEEKRRSFGDQCKALVSGIFLCAEGLATLLEHLHYWLDHSWEETEDRFRHLPADYLRAFFIYEKLANRWGVPPKQQFDKQLNYFNIGTISRATTEYILDFPVRQAMQQESEFETIVSRLLQTKTPDQMLSTKLDIAVGVPAARFKAILLDPSIIGLAHMEAIALKARQHIQNIKMELIQADPEAAGWGWIGDDATRIHDVERLESSLVRALPALKPLTTASRSPGQVHLFDPPVRLSFGPSRFYHDCSLIPVDKFPEAMDALAKQKGFVGFGLLVWEVGIRSYSVIATPFIVRPHGILRKRAFKVGSKVIQTVGVTEEWLSSLDRPYAGWPSVWIGLYVPKDWLGEPRTQFGTGTFREAQSPIFIYCPSFSWDVVDEVVETFGSIQELVVFSQSFINGAEIVCIYTKRVIVYSFLPTLRFKSEGYVKRGIAIQKRELKLAEQPLLAKAALCAEMLEHTLADSREENE